jgi:hypothetical protein
MRKTAFVIAGLVSAASIALVGCDVQKTQEGHVQMPKYEVSKTQDGDVQLPKYNVEAPKVDVTTTQKEITVPKVEITPAKDRDDNKVAEKK